MIHVRPDNEIDDRLRPAGYNKKGLNEMPAGSLMHDKIENVEEAFGLSCRASSIIRQNIVISLGVMLFLLVAELAEKITLPLASSATKAVRFSLL